MTYQPNKKKKALNRKLTHDVILDPKKQSFLANYYDPNSETYANAYQSARKAGYGHYYAKTLMSPSFNNKWVKPENYYKETKMTPAHIIKSAENLVLKSKKEETKIRALDFLAKVHGMMVEKKITATVNIEELLNTQDEPNRPTEITDITD